MYARFDVAKSAGNAMPLRLQSQSVHVTAPRSSATRTSASVAFGSFGKLTSLPARCVTYHRALSPGRWNIAVGFVRLTFGNRLTSCTLPVGGGAVNALQVGFAGRSSRPIGAASGGGRA